ncbi:ribonuclease HII [Kamptonema animale CS-326]|nr:ribonuclease HII [Kamptonema animale CS-326]
MGKIKGQDGKGREDREDLTSPSPPSPPLPLSPSLIAGVDEVGRGAWFGPVVAAACILPPEALEELTALGVRDSKQLSPAARSRLAVKIQAMAVDCQIGVASVREIDQINILQASLLAMKRAILKLNTLPELCLIDGNQRIPNLVVPKAGYPYAQQTMIQGDRRSLVIAAASIVAKVWRDELIVRMAVKFPEYDLTNNKGYGTPKHRLGLERYGVSPFHRTSFSPCRK